MVEKQGSGKRRSWRKFHISVDAGTGQIAAVELTSPEVDDASQVGPLLDQVTAPVVALIADGAYDRIRVYRAASGGSGDRAAARRRGA